MRQGNDVGTQYRSAIYTYGDAQRAAAEASRDAYARALRAARRGEITTEIGEAREFYYAEAYHQQYLAKNPWGYCGIGGTGVRHPATVAEIRTPEAATTSPGPGTRHARGRVERAGPRPRLTYHRRVSFALRTAGHRLAGLVPDLAAGSVSALVTLSYSISYAALIFSGPTLEPFVPAGLHVALIAAAVVALVVALLSSAPFAIGGPDSNATGDPRHHGGRPDGNAHRGRRRRGARRRRGDLDAHDQRRRDGPHRPRPRACSAGAAWSACSPIRWPAGSSPARASWSSPAPSRCSPVSR